MEIRVVKGDKWQLFSPVLPEGCTPLGIVVIDGDGAALARLRNGTLVRVNYNVVRNLSSTARDIIEQLLLDKPPLAEQDSALS